jgi:hypothetical protein
MGGEMVRMLVDLAWCPFLEEALWLFLLVERMLGRSLGKLEL